MRLYPCLQGAPSPTTSGVSSHGSEDVAFEGEIAALTEVEDKELEVEFELSGG